jgi:hypothetical protein
MKIKLMSFTDNLTEVNKFNIKKFNCEIDDVVNNVYCCELNLKDCDGSCLLSILSDIVYSELNCMVIINNDDRYIVNNNSDCDNVYDEIKLKYNLTDSDIWC